MSVMKAHVDMGALKVLFIEFILKRDSNEETAPKRKGYDAALKMSYCAV